MTYRINAPRIAHETIDDETIIIDFDSGTYYSVRATANTMWQLLSQGKSVEEVIRRVQAEYQGNAEQMAAAVHDFVTLLVREKGLLVAAPATGNGAVQPLSTPAAKTPFTQPVLEQYTDMQDLLLLDPIHEVDDQGWPQRKP